MSSGGGCQDNRQDARLSGARSDPEPNQGHDKSEYELSKALMKNRVWRTFSLTETLIIIDLIGC